MDLRELLIGRLARLADIKRYSVYPRTRDESVAEHTFFALTFASFIVDDLKRADVKDIDEAWLYRAILKHDWTESFSGDIDGPFKWRHHDVASESEIAAAGDFASYTKDLLETSTRDTMQEIHDANYKRGGMLEMMILKFCDFLSVLQFLLIQKEQGNQLFIDMVVKQYDRAVQFTEKVVTLGGGPREQQIRKVLCHWMGQAQKIAKEIDDARSDARG